MGVLLFSALPGQAGSDKAGIRYEVAITGVADRVLESLLRRASLTVEEREAYPPATLRLLERRVREDIPRLETVMRSEGYYDSRITFRLEEQAQLVRVDFKVEPGPLYVLRHVEIEPTDALARPGAPEMPAPVHLGLVPGSPARAKAILDGEAQLLVFLRDKGYPYPAVSERHVIVDHSGRAVDVAFTLGTGPRAVFGKTGIRGLERLKEGVVRALIPWKRGEIYSPVPVMAFQERLRATGLFSVVRVEKGLVSKTSGELPLTVVLMERKPRTVSTSLYYRTDEGLGTRFAWEDRNIFGRGERAGFAATVSRFEQGGEFSFRKPWFLRQDQRLEITLRLADDEPDAYSARSYTGRFLVGREVAEKLELGAGVQAKVSDVTQFEETGRFKYLALPFSLTWDATDDLLNPHRGSRLAVETAPYLDLQRREADFLKLSGTMTHYLGILDKPRLLLAGRLSAGAEPGPSVLDLPADERFYAGGGGSIRGYTYQTVGPLRDGQPVGGKALLEMSLEVRLDVTEQVGIVAFLDGGSSFSRRILDGSADVLWGTGLGLRYITPVGPLRLDVGIPLQRRPEIDDPFQVYVSLGQSF